MHWAKGRQFFIWFILVGSILAIIASVIFVVMYKVPSCNDAVQNQDEKGIDCGGACSKVCSFDVKAPVVSFPPRVLNQSSGRTDVIAYIENRNATAQASAASYILELYDANNEVITTKTGVMKLPVTARPIPLFIPSVYIGSRLPTHANVTFADTIDWQTASPVPFNEQLTTAAPVLSGESATPKIVATIHNPQPTSILNVKVVVAVFDTQNSIMAASQTLLREVPAQGDATATFTWNEAFPGPYSRIEILPLYP